MFMALVIVFLAVPIAELYVISRVAAGIGLAETLLALILISVVGAWLTKLTGLGVLRRLQRTVRAGKVPSAELVDGVLVLLAGALLLTPGFVTDGVALVLLLPPSRAVARRSVLSRIRAGGGLVTVVRGRPADEVRDVNGWEDPPERPGLSP